jgi:hypothetical protein
VKVEESNIVRSYYQTLLQCCDANRVGAIFETLSICEVNQVLRRYNDRVRIIFHLAVTHWVTLVGAVILLFMFWSTKFWNFWEKLGELRIACGSSNGIRWGDSLRIVGGNWWDIYVLKTAEEGWVLAGECCSRDRPEWTGKTWWWERFQSSLSRTSFTSVFSKWWHEGIIARLDWILRLSGEIVLLLSSLPLA